MTDVPQHNPLRRFLDALREGSIPFDMSVLAKSPIALRSGENLAFVCYEVILKEPHTVDKGDLVLTTRRYVFLGEKRTLSVDLSEIIGVEPYGDAVAIHRAGKEQTERHPRQWTASGCAPTTPCEWCRSGGYETEEIGRPRQSERTVLLLHLNHYFTYEGLPVGHPTTGRNREQLQRLVAHCHHPEGYGEPYLIEPIETLLELPEAQRRPGTPAALPSITCIARFMSDVLPHDAENIASVLRVIWFQYDLALPIDPYVLSQFAVMDWEKHAVGWLP
jgi:hypothetical protein